jgi:putative transcriptional regulator
MTSEHHPRPETLISYVAGTLPNAIACVVACHVSLCRECASDIRRLEMLAGTMLRQVESPPAESEAIERAVQRLYTDGGTNVSAWLEPPAIAEDPVLPRPLIRYLGFRSEEIPWRKVVKGVRQHWVKLPKGSGQLRLLRLAPRKPLLEHTHSGMELTLVLKGVYGDHTGDYRRGDVIEWSEGSLHQPGSSGDEECVCMIATESVPRYARFIARVLRPIMGF